MAELVRPTHFWVPEHVDTYGPQVADLCRLAKFEPDPEQQMGLDAIFAVDEADKVAALEAAVVVGRQNMKTGLFKMATIGWLFLLDQRLVVWSAHEFRTSQEAFRDMEELIMGTPQFAKRVKQIHRGNGDEAIELFDDRRLIFKARTKSGGRGLSGDKIILDEGFALQPSHMGSLFPTLAARPDPQVVYGSSAGKVESGVLRAIRDRGRTGGDPSLAYIEYCAPPPKEACADGENCTHARDVQGCGCDNMELIKAANPAIGRRITVSYVRGERRALPPAEFARERMGWWDDPIGSEVPIKPAEWTACLDEESRRTGSVALAVDITPDRSVSSIAISGRRADGLVHGEVIEHRAGTGWVVDRIVELFKTVQPTPVALVIDPAGPAGSLEKKLLEKGFSTDKELLPGAWRLHFMGSREYAQACGALADDIANGEFRHIGQAPLDTAVEGVATRPLAEAWAWSRGKSGATIAPLVAVTLARHGHATFGVTEPVAPFALFGKGR
ncbi:terminase [Streptomyces cocklensis]|uniref:Phage terminase large subunit-like protein n=1 Tax=Actinacidiphila cocklensis TaxID=887465 RepID=A0A9W4E3T4_9ACTN|nr:terminase [Actinacidiphila cocklensis]MDD1057902.1 terminase [Actinacidiphila cocklensis]CAG6392765.1 Phage terminase large subunit-like protein [Actinacidiphila cocklensis]